MTQTKPDPIVIQDSHAAISREIPMTSHGFYECNLFLLKNIKSGDALMMHSNFSQSSSDPFFYRKPRGAKTDSDKVPHHTLKGISDSQAECLKEFLAQDGEKYGISFYKNQHGYLSVGGKKDHGITKFLESKGVKMRRHAIPVFEDTFKFYGFDAHYDPFDDSLNVTSRALKEDISGGITDDPKAIFSPTGDGTDISLLKIHPFQNLELWKSQQGQSR